ncbi:MAG TPA: hypothetical protein VFM93_03005 [Candidatus Limnocylindria bacterium]|nr:hypothetical protein [Candidatus Limnocylindria bacterium]
MDERQRAALTAWVDGLAPDARVLLYHLASELCGGMDVTRHNDFGFLRLRAEFETSGELFGCSLEDLRDALGAALGPEERAADRPQSALQMLRARVAREGHPDFR